MKDPRSLPLDGKHWFTDSRTYNLIWLGRWLERAENIARAVDAAAIAGIHHGNDQDVMTHSLDATAAAWGISLDQGPRVLSDLIRDHNPSSVYYCLTKARDNATQVCPLELIRAISEIVLGMERRDNLPHSPEETHRLMSSILESIKVFNDAIDEQWFRREPLSEDEMYRRFMQQQQQQQ